MDSVTYDQSNVKLKMGHWNIRSPENSNLSYEYCLYIIFIPFTYYNLFWRVCLDQKILINDILVCNIIAITTLSLIFLFNVNCLHHLLNKFWKVQKANKKQNTTSLGFLLRLLKFQCRGKMLCLENYGPVFRNKCLFRRFYLYICKYTQRSYRNVESFRSLQCSTCSTIVMLPYSNII